MRCPHCGRGEGAQTDERIVFTDNTAKIIPRRTKGRVVLPDGFTIGPYDEYDDGIYLNGDVLQYRIPKWLSKQILDAPEEGRVSQGFRRGMAEFLRQEAEKSSRAMERSNREVRKIEEDGGER